MDWNELKGSLTSISEEEQAITNLVMKMRMRRIEIGYSQKHLAELVGLTRVSIARIEGQSIVPRLEVVFRMCLELGLTLDIQINKQMEEHHERN